MKKDKINWNDISFIMRGKRRKAILNLLDKPKTPTQLKEKTKLHFTTISRALIELEKTGFAKCLTPNQKLWRFYELTEKGKKIKEEIKKNQNFKCL